MTGQLLKNQILSSIHAGSREIASLHRMRRRQPGKDAEHRALIKEINSRLRTWRTMLATTEEAE